jgi:hypothetical protein
MTNDDLDNILDTALARYSGEEPLAGLEQRVLNRARAEGRVRRFRWGRWVLAIVVVCTITLAVLPKRPLPTAKLGGGLQSARGFSPAVANRSVPPRQARQARRPALPPLSREERAWLALAARAPNPAGEALLDLERRGTEPIQVEEIKIEPLRSLYANDDTK